MSGAALLSVGIISFVFLIFLVIYVVFIHEFGCNNPYCDPETSVEYEKNKTLFNWFRGSDKKSGTYRTTGYERLVHD